jgi:hypothetical protein
LDKFAVRSSAQQPSSPRIHPALKMAHIAMQGGLGTQSGSICLIA